MRKAIHKISAFLMALVVLFSTMSFTVSMHYCQGELIDTAIFQKAHTCDMEMGGESEMKMDGCCNDQEIKIEGQDELKLPVADLNIGQQVFVISFLHSYIELFQTTEQRKNTFFDYPPPFIVRQIFKLDETYLI
ncbi:HYC_CC_PP family protein [Pseudotenacibaculum haliotis]